ncbi:hypothetical protein [Fibrobacter sp.]|uniref:hypothetical protein n=1 Tax=Fibrobacter sp. TaxID=35828 RepID=UPI003866459E
MRVFLRKIFLLTAVVLCGLVFDSCAMIFSVSRPDLSQKEYTALIINDKKAAQCYVEETRVGMIILDAIFWPALLVDGLGGYYTYYSYSPAFCSNNSINSAEPVSVAEKKWDVDKIATNTQKNKKSVSSRPVFVAVLESVSGGILKYQENQFITNVLREEAVKALSSEINATIMTRENIREMLPPEKSLEDCEGACIVETGKNISADYVSQARVGTFGKNLTISVELYKTSNNKLVSSFNTKAQDIDALEEKIRENASGMFADIIREELNR